MAQDVSIPTYKDVRNGIADQGVACFFAMVVSPEHSDAKHMTLWQNQLFGYYDPHKSAWLTTKAFQHFPLETLYPAFTLWEALPLEARTPNCWGIFLGLSRFRHHWTFIDDIKVDLFDDPVQAVSYCEHWLAIQERYFASHATHEKDISPAAHPHYPKHYMNLG